MTTTVPPRLDDLTRSPMFWAAKARLADATDELHRADTRLAVLHDAAARSVKEWDAIEKAIARGEASGWLWHADALAGHPSGNRIVRYCEPVAPETLAAALAARAEAEAAVEAARDELAERAQDPPYDPIAAAKAAGARHVVRVPMMRWDAGERFYRGQPFPDELLAALPHAKAGAIVRHYLRAVR